MTSFRMQWLAVLALGAGVACGGGGGPSPESLVGNWIASPAHSGTMAQFVEKSNPSVKVDLVAAGGTLTLALRQDKSFGLTISVPGDALKVVTGHWSSSVDVLTLTFESGFSGDMQFGLSMSGSTLALDGADAPFDVDDDGVDEETKLSLRMVRQ